MKPLSAKSGLRPKSCGRADGGSENWGPGSAIIVASAIAPRTLPWITLSRLAVGGEA